MTRCDEERRRGTCCDESGYSEALFKELDHLHAVGINEVNADGGKLAGEQIADLGHPLI